MRGKEKKGWLEAGLSHRQVSRLFGSYSEPGKFQR